MFSWRINRREIAALTTDAVSLDHRRGAAFAPGEGFEYIRAGWDLGQNLNIYTEIAHRLNDLGAVFTYGPDMGPRTRASSPSGGASP